MRRYLGFLWRVVLGVFAFVFLALVRGLGTSLAFPYGGREFHAIFAYSAGGRLSAALRVYLIYVLTLTIGARLLIALRYPLRPITVAGIAAGVCALAWWQVVIWPVQSRPFHLVALGLFEVTPILVIGAIFLTVMPRELARMARDQWRGVMGG